MKPAFTMIAAAFFFFLMACCKKEQVIPLLKNGGCETLFAALLEKDDATLDSIMDSICADFLPNVTNDDPYGHQSNLNNIIEALNEQCPMLNASLGCYACMESLPPWSIVDFSLDSSGVLVARQVFLLTPSDGPMRSNW